jgi:PAS domain-containing protein
MIVPEYFPTGKRWMSTRLIPITGSDGEVNQIIGISTDVTDQKQAEEVIKKSFRYNRSLIESCIDPLVVINPDGRITYVNTATEGMTGYSREDLIGTDFAKYYSDPEKERSGYLSVLKDGLVSGYPGKAQHIGTPKW